MNLLCGKKLGMTRFYTLEGSSCASTLVELGPCFIVKKKFEEIDGYNAIQIGYNICSTKHLTKAYLGIFENSNLIPLSYLYEVLNVNPNDFRIGQSLDTARLRFTTSLFVKSQTIGKGFCGVIKRYNFARGPKTHGSKHHRKPGSIGQGTTPGRVFKGKKMAGNVGSKFHVTVNLRILKINPKKNLVWFKGSFAGSTNAFIKII